MSNETLYGLASEINVASGSNPPITSSRQGTQLADTLHGRYTEQANRGRLHWASAIVTAPVIFSTAAGTGGPLLYNGTSASAGVKASILAVGISQSVVTTVAGAVGLTGGPTTAPGSTTAIDGQTSGYIGGTAANCSVYRVGTPSAAGTFFMPLADVHTGALTVDTGNIGWIDIGGGFIVPPGYFISLAGSATLSTLVARLTLVWEEIPV